MRMHHMLAAAAGAFAFGVSGASAQLLGGDVAGGLTGQASGALNTGPLDAGARGAVDSTVRGGAHLDAPRTALPSADVRPDTRLRTNTRADTRTQTDTRAGFRGDVAAPANVQAGLRVTQRQDHEHGSYVHVENRGWVWVPAGASLESALGLDTGMSANARTGADVRLGAR